MGVLPTKLLLAARSLGDGTGFQWAFALGADDKTIRTLDSDGVMYAALQGLVEELRERDKTIGELIRAGERLQNDAAHLQQEVDKIRAEVRGLRPSPRRTDRIRLPSSLSLCLRAERRVSAFRLNLSFLRLSTLR